MSTDYRYFPTLAIPAGTAGQVLTKSSGDPDNGAQWADPQVGTGPQGPPGPTGPVGPAGAAGATGATGAGPYCFQGSGPPTALFGVAGDTYIDDDTGSIYLATGPGTWLIPGRLNVNNLSVSGLFSGGITRDVVLGASAAGWKWVANGSNAFALVVIPYGWSTYNLEIVLINAAAGNVQVNCAAVAYDDGVATSYPAGTSTTKTFASTAGTTPEVLSFGPLACAANAGKLQAIRLQRVSATSTSFVVAGVNVRRMS